MSLLSEQEKTLIATMFNSKGLPKCANWSHSGRMSKLPPRSPLPNITHPSTEFGSSQPIVKKQASIPKDNHRQHQRASSESFIEEQPYWLDDLLNEHETPVVRGTHRRSSSDSLAYQDILGTSFNVQSIPQRESWTGNDPSLLPSSVSLPLDMKKDTSRASMLEIGSNRILLTRAWKSSINSLTYQTCVASMGQQDNECFIEAKKEREKTSDHDHRESSERKEKLFVKLNASDVCPSDQKGCCGRKEESSHGKPTAPDADPKQTKLHFAQRSRVRKLQYIAELERNVNLLHAEGSDVAAELAFLKQQHLILSLENKALVQRITSIAHEKKIKDAQYELLRKEVDRLREVYCNRRSKCQRLDNTVEDPTDHLDVRFSCLSLGSLNDWETGSVKEAGVMNKVAPYPCMMLQKS